MSDSSLTQPVIADDGTPLSCRIWPARTPSGEGPEQESAGAAQGRLVIVHGFSEHSGRYAHVAAAFAAQGWHVMAFDQRGHGSSPGRRGVLQRFDCLIDDVVAAVRDAASRLPATGPTVVLGHSMGGLVTLRTLQARSREMQQAGVRAAVLTAPWLGDVRGVPRATRIVLRALAAMAPNLALSRPMRTDVLVADAEMAADRMRDPLMHSQISAGLLTEVQRAQAEARLVALDGALPLLVVLPGDDRLLDDAATRQWIEMASRKGSRIEVREWPRRRHEPLNDVGRDEVIEHLVRWVGAHAEFPVPATNRPSETGYES